MYWLNSTRGEIRVLGPAGFQEIGVTITLSSEWAYPTVASSYGSNRADHLKYSRKKIMQHKKSKAHAEDVNVFHIRGEESLETNIVDR